MIHIQDSRPDVELSQIEPTEARIRSLVARNLHAFESFDENISIVGSLRIIEGLCYHYRNYRRLCVESEGYFERIRAHSAAVQSGASMDELPELELADEVESSRLACINHEYLAYINRMGQFYAFARARRVHGCMPRTLSLMPFRNKHAAHRSIDVPRPEDEEQKVLQAISIGLATTYINGELVLTMNHGDKHLRFILDKDHPLIIDEAYQAYSSIFVPGEPV